MAAVRDRSATLLCVALLLCGLYLVLGPYLRLSQWSIAPDTNEAFQEARAWLAGRADIDISPQLSDVAIHNGRLYNPFPPLLTMLCAAMLALQRALGDTTNTLYSPWYVLMTVVPLPLLGFWAFREVLQERSAVSDQRSARIEQGDQVRDPGAPANSAASVGSADPTYKAEPGTGDLALGTAISTGATANLPLSTISPFAALLTFAWLTGTALQPVLAACRAGHQCHINHVLSQMGLVLIAGDALGRRRWWPAAIGLVIAAWSRQLTIFYALPLLYIAWSSRASNPRTSVRGLVVIALGASVAVAGLMTVNYLRFGNPLDSGYMYMYERRDDAVAWLAKTHGLFTTAMIGENFRCMNLNVPPWEISGAGPRPQFDNRGTSMWFTTPLLLLVLWEARRWWRDAARRALMLGTFAVIAGLLLYHTTGAGQSGYYRYSLDFIPIWLAVIAPAALRYPRLTLACTAWSAIYYTLI